MASGYTASAAVNRFGLGARPGELAAAGADPVGWLRAQLHASPQPAGSEALPGSGQIGALVAPARTEPTKLPALLRPKYVAEAQVRFRHAVTTPAPLTERLVHFWSNHFAVSVDKIATLGFAGPMEREAIRPNLFGRFDELLLAAVRHPAMILYLDNQASIGPDSKAAKFAARRKGVREPGLNENLAREILELHTLGVAGGYAQADVTNLARILTGWSVGGGPGRLAAGEPGEFVFRDIVHEPGAQELLGKRYAQSGYEQGVAALRSLAAHPATARHVATKLARHFVADAPPPSLVEKLVTAFRAHRGALLPVYEVLIDAPESWSTDAAKFKTPADYVHSTFRGLGIPVAGGRSGLVAFELLGQRTWSPGSPAGWPDTAADWDGASSIMKRIEWSDAIGARLGDRRDAKRMAPALLGESLGGDTALALARAASGAQAITLLLTSPEFMRR